MTFDFPPILTVLPPLQEEFIKKLSTVSYVRADIEKRAITSYGDVGTLACRWTIVCSNRVDHILADTVDKFPEFHFLKGMPQ